MTVPGSDSEASSDLEEFIYNKSYEIAYKVISDHLFLCDKYKDIIINDIVSDARDLIENGFRIVLRTFEVEDMRAQMLEEDVQTMDRLMSPKNIDKNGMYSGSENIVKAIFDSYYDDYNDTIYDAVFEIRKLVDCYDLIGQAVLLIEKACWEPGSLLHNKLKADVIRMWRKPEDRQ